MWNYGKIIFIIICIFLANTAAAQKMVVVGKSKLFSVSAEFFDSTGNGEFDVRHTTLEKFNFTYEPKFPWSPLKLYLRSVFGPNSFTLTKDDVMLGPYGVGNPSEKYSTGILHIKLKDHVRHLMRGYEWMEFVIKPDDWHASHGETPHIYLEQGDLGKSQTLLHTIVIGRQFFRGPIVQCEVFLRDIDSLR